MSTLTNVQKESTISYLLTDALDYILVGSSEDETLILKTADIPSNITKNSSTLTNINKN
ncbi:MAG: hypothetical protein UT51_C0011G0013 [Candidatus Nomurabacteria bacterium GW2011_GWC2_39_41]|uniref:Uncharacterized protein n=2 Tax=Parcubacteria group TaxID=1794811 RepID=A0A0G1PP59_9BACT|nr:MAG: hypothetical protein UT51_C0011G0013 [Candidatus Nomurabacteria bacterium GW2011_GWC2_39_41]KKU34566.1 MAG: hypothetical protein UX48_C0031G0014 [Candidatus Azambacteria bacterium GW2011_GWB1_46_27]